MSASKALQAPRDQVRLHLPVDLPALCRTDQEASNASYGRNLRFLANVDPVDVARALNGLRPETTLVVVVSKTFTTAETMLNARTVRYTPLWLPRLGRLMQECLHVDVCLHIWQILG